MSEGSDQEDKPIIHGTNLTTNCLERPRRATRREVDYRNSGEGGSRQESEGEAFNRGAFRRIRQCSTETLWGGSASDTTETGDCWSPKTVERRTGILFDGVDQLKTQLRQLKMAKKEEMSVQGLLQIMLEMNNKQEQERQTRELKLAEEAREREVRDREEMLQRERRMEEDSRIRMEKMADEARIREEERKKERE